jgi:hypothetical protein
MLTHIFNSRTWENEARESSVQGQPGLYSEFQTNLSYINSFSKVARYKINIQKSVAFLYTNNKQAEKEIREIIIFTTA